GGYFPHLRALDEDLRTSAGGAAPLAGETDEGGAARLCTPAQDVTADEVVVQVHESAHADVEGGGAVGEFIAVQRHARFQAEAVARRETATGDPGGKIGRAHV